ncbi:MarR family winged helix-turn-helix transcriptional regulator [Xanthocytophaga flava]|uniref:MarR family winged helix-turn-helix transcriptional regulator n=1 Tax=Xanthocytophaga flava TaxID=3048013 RepID=UPI0028D17A01|nr:MarR family transcriptional regulator [Xanthocytophaga flavus]MDJ1466409.1 MarR family transcriptional regulator [Xanthocytophaga flavus]
MIEEHLKLENQLCFPVYAASRLITREYQPFLDELGITYPQYLVLLVLWENDKITVNEIRQKLILNTNTVTPLLQRMEGMELIQRTRSEEDERKVIVALTEKGKALQQQASTIPGRLIACLSSEELNLQELVDLRDKLHHLLDFLLNKNQSVD